MTCEPAKCEGKTCIAFKHSGSGNCDPCADLGGEISECSITCDELENLFHSIGPKLSRKGHEDYRCFYIKNISETFTIRNAIVYFNGTGRGVPGVRGGTYVALGVLLRSEIQQVVVSGTAPPYEGEFFELQVPGYSSPFQVYYSPNITQWVGNFQTSIRAVEGLSGVVVTSEVSDAGIPNVTFTIDYGGYGNTQSSNRKIDLITENSNDLTGCTVTYLPVTDGSPVNTDATTIDDETTPPDGIDFDYYFRGNPIRIGDLMPGDSVPLWIRRTLPFPEPAYGALARPGQMAKLLDNFQIAIDATYP